jgi:hypothetical protein
MTDITDQDRRDARQWAEGFLSEPGVRGSRATTAARVILATVDAPAPTLEEGIREWVEKRYSGVIGTGKYELIALADRAAQVEHDLAEAHAEVERLTDVNENLRRTDNYREFREQFLTVQKGAESNAESNAERHNPADVKPGEVWIVDVGEREAVATRDGSSDQYPWSAAFFDGEIEYFDDESITLITRLVPAPRVITDADELDTLAEQAIVRDHTDGEALQKINGKWIAARPQRDDGFSSWSITPVTVLWEPEA